MTLWLADAHNWYQSNLDPSRLAGEGFAGLIVKATQGVDSYSAPWQFDAWLNTVRAGGGVPGAYHWLDGSDGARQAERFVTRCSDQLSAGPLLLCVDNEDTYWPAAPATLEAFVARLRQLVGDDQPIGHYSGKWWYSAHFGAYRAADLGLWCWDSKYVSGSGYASALYGSVSDGMWVPGYGGWSRSTVLQFSASGTAAGVTANLDLDAFGGTIDDLWALAGAASSTGRNLGMIFHNGLPTGRSYVAVVGSRVFTDWAQIESLIAAGLPQYQMPPAKFSAFYAELTQASPTPPPATLEVTPETLQVLLAEMRTAVDSAVAQRFDRLFQALGAFGDEQGQAAAALGALNDGPSGPAPL